ncbi:hypothetical protein SUGI_0695350 [Cryptomeria japonica]|nr:hypothetical protein SUGI_0695350 [Cryptomeria japonica]
MKLQINAGIGHLTKLTELHISECPEIEEMPVVCGLSCLERVTIDGWGKFKYLHVIDRAILKVVRGNFDLGHLTQLWISDCTELEELSCFARLTCLMEIRIFKCRKLQKVTLPRTLKNLQLGSCKELKSLSGISCLKNLVELAISECEQLELDLHLELMDSLQKITFDGCGKMIVIDSCEKLQSILLPTTLIKLTVQRCRELRMVTGIGNLTKLTDMCIGECPELEELPILAGLSCLKMIVIDSCEKLQSILLPTKLINLTVRKCRKLKMVAGTGCLCIGECPELEELPILTGLSCLKTIVIDSCEKLQSILLPITTLINLTVRRCRELKMVAGIGNL